MKGRILTIWAVAALLVVSLVFPGVVGASSGVSVAPQAGAPGTQFVITGAGLAASAKHSVLVERGQVFGQTYEVTTDTKGRFALTLDSTGFEESTGYSATVFAAGGGSILGSTRFAVQANQPERHFAETGFTVRGRFLAYWEATGGLAINGFPLSEEFSEVLENGQPYTVQYFERTRLEYHPESADVQFEVLLGQFGRRIHPADPPGMPDSTMVWFTETGHNVPNDFYGFWSANGGLAQFGYPISEVITEKLGDGNTYQVQYFERARLERHPENVAPYDILLGQFGRIVLAQVVR
ncbi:MAG: hypothetical protein U0232_24635 [Thermomicrobiales bacterium]